MYEKLISVVIMLFILSMISERLVTYIKLWCKQGKKFLFGLVSADVDTSTKSDNPAKETIRTKSILAINLTIGFLTALIAKASFFDMFGTVTVPTTLGWHIPVPFDLSEIKLTRLVGTIIGCAFTGAFISLGSKFWHDMLDLLFEAKNLKAKLVDKATYEANTLKHLDEYIQTDYYQLATICLQQNKEKIAVLKSVENFFVGVSSNPQKRNPLIILHSSLNRGGNYPTSFMGSLSSGGSFTIETEVVYGYKMPEIHFDSGKSICNKSYKHKLGTACCELSINDKKYILTCGHVLTGGAKTIKNGNGWFNNPILNDTLSKETGFSVVGTWSYGLINDELDIALIETSFDITPIVNIQQIPSPYKPELNGNEVYVNGNKNKSNAYIIGFSEQLVEFKYNSETNKIKNLIIISGNKYPPYYAITEKGDSGAMVFLTEDNKALGIILGGNDQYTYVMPMSSILKETKASLT